MDFTVNEWCPVYKWSAHVRMCMLLVSCGVLPMACGSEPLECNASEGLYGEVFIEQAAHTTVSCEKAFAEDFIGILRDGTRARDMKDQCVALLWITYADGHEIEVEVTEMGLARYGGKVVQINREEMMEFLKKIQVECRAPVDE